MVGLDWCEIQADRDGSSNKTEKYLYFLLTFSIKVLQLRDERRWGTDFWDLATRENLLYNSD